MAILGVLLGITMTVLGGCIWYGNKQLGSLHTHAASAIDRIVFLERRKTVLAEAATSHPKPAGVGAVKMRTWNEDAVGREQ